jgi:hypothetical protein
MLLAGTHFIRDFTLEKSELTKHQRVSLRSLYRLNNSLNRDFMYLFLDSKLIRIGFGKSLLQPVLQLADSTHTKCFAATSSEPGHPFLLSCGFKIIKEFNFKNKVLFRCFLRDPL